MVRIVLIACIIFVQTTQLICFTGNSAGEQRKYDRWRERMGMEPDSTIDGEVEIIEGFEIPQLDRTRTLRIFLPEEYRDSEERYPVIYMHDGQNLFDDRTSFVGEWHVDEAINRFIRQDDWGGAIVVGIDNDGKRRLDEYSPWVNPKRGGGEGEAYVEFLVKTLKPWIDNKYRTLPDRDNTAIAGSSMGGLISLYAGLKYPEVYSKLGVFSPAFWFAKRELIDLINRARIEDDVRIYMDAGTLESPSYVPDAREIATLLRNRGVKNLLLVVDDGARHNETAWSRRFPEAIRWLMVD